jgi:hypothetical protein
MYFILNYMFRPLFLGHLQASPENDQIIRVETFSGKWNVLNVKQLC